MGLVLENLVISQAARGFGEATLGPDDGRVYTRLANVFPVMNQPG